MSTPEAASKKSDNPFFRRIGEGLGLIKEPLFKLGEELTLINPNTRALGSARVRTIDSKGRLTLEFADYPIPVRFDTSDELLEALDDAEELQEEREAGVEGARPRNAILPPDPAAVRIRKKKNPNPEPQLEHAAYTRVVGTPLGALREYAGRERITSRTASVQGKVLLPEGLENRMEGIVVDYEKDAVLREYLEKKMLPYLLRQRIFGKAANFASTIEDISKKISKDFPYQQKMLEDEYGQRRYPWGHKIYLGKVMDQQDMVCRHMGLLFAVTIDYLKAQGAGERLAVPATSEVRFMADMQRDLDEEKRNGHAYCVMQNGGEYYVIDPTSGLARNVREVLASSDTGNQKYRYLFSALRFMVQSPSTQNDQFILQVMRKTRTEPKLVGLIADLRKTLVKDPALVERIASLEKQAR